MERPKGRTGAGATTHCVHGKNTAMRELVLDWKPFDYYTVEQDSGPMGVVQATFRLEPVDAEHTARRAPQRWMPGLPRFLHRPLIRFMYTRLLQLRSVLLKMKTMVEAQPDATPAPPALGQAATA